MHLAKPCPCAGAFYLFLAIYTQSSALQQLLFMLLADLPRQSTLVFLIRLKSLRQSTLQPCCCYLLLKFNIWNIQGRRTGFCQAEKVPCLGVTQTLTLSREWAWQSELLLCCAAQSVAAKWRFCTRWSRTQLTAKPLVALFSADFDTSTSPKRLCPGPLVSSWASVHWLLLHPLSWFSTYAQLFPFQEVVSQGKQRAWLTNSLSTRKNSVNSNLIPRTNSKHFLSKALKAFYKHELINSLTK